jgi:hypothetical protein
VVRVGVTDHPTDEWITQQVRGATPFEAKPTYLICDNDRKYGSMFERVAQASGIEVIHRPYEAPRANAICERFVGSLWRECLDHLLVIGELQLIRVLKAYVAYFNPARPHQGIAQQIPAPTISPVLATRFIRRHQRQVTQAREMVKPVQYRHGDAFASDTLDRRGRRCRERDQFPSGCGRYASSA